MMRGMNMQGMLKQMQKLQKNMKADQDKLNETVFEGHSANDIVVVKFTGDRKMTDISIKEEAVDPDDVDMLQDLVIMAVNDAMDKINEETQRTMGKYSQNIPGF
ncbi:DNA-binding protein, YbaB EbfC family [Ligilactobacillus hayakitensis DSM 18933 = JCM 14209]|uniref:Nucleoid-associated protein FC40_GL000991 n=2 Tax=Ligilactobacillus TaxID=2767887 RepID=A0A0R1WKH3_9LACO|nr:DNA-binding protein, YbaB EbfC family [Ligilactobacillus hayakitensis DSM 18933 = JCM 14209]